MSFCATRPCPPSTLWEPLQGNGQSVHGPCLNIKGETQYNVRASRELRPNIDEVKVGPFSYEIIEPLKKVRCTLAENDYDLSFQVELEGTMPPHEEDPQFTKERGRILENVVRGLAGG